MKTFPIKSGFAIAFGAFLLSLGSVVQAQHYDEHGHGSAHAYPQHYSPQSYRNHGYGSGHGYPSGHGYSNEHASPQHGHGNSDHHSYGHGDQGYGSYGHGNTGYGAYGHGYGGPSSHGNGHGVSLQRHRGQRTVYLQVFGH